MDLIASIKYIENRLGGYPSNKRKRKPEPQISRSHVAYQKNAQSNPDNVLSEEDILLGRNIDISA